MILNNPNETATGREEKIVYPHIMMRVFGIQHFHASTFSQWFRRMKRLADETKRDPAPMSSEDGDIPRIPSGSDEAGTERGKENDS